MKRRPSLYITPSKDKHFLAQLRRIGKGFAPPKHEPPDESALTADHEQTILKMEAVTVELMDTMKSNASRILDIMRFEAGAEVSSTRPLCVAVAHIDNKRDMLALRAATLKHGLNIVMLMTANELDRGNMAALLNDTPHLRQGVIVVNTLKIRD